MNLAPNALLQVLPTVHAVQAVQSLQVGQVALPPQVTPTLNVGILPMIVKPIAEIENHSVPITVVQGNPTGVVPIKDYTRRLSTCGILDFDIKTHNFP